MAKKPSLSSHRSRPEEGLNLTPLIDMITCLMFFLMMFASILPIVIIDAPLPKIASNAEEVKIAKKTENQLEIMVYINSKGLQVKTSAGDHAFSVSADGKYPYDEFHKYLVQVKGKHDSKEITMMPADDTPYEVMVNVMDASRELQKDDPGFQPVPPEIASKPESQQFNRLFPDVSIGGV